MHIENIIQLTGYMIVFGLKQYHTKNTQQHVLCSVPQGVLLQGLNVFGRIGTGDPREEVVLVHPHGLAATTHDAAAAERAEEGEEQNHHHQHPCSTGHRYDKHLTCCNVKTVARCTALKTKLELYIYM